MKPPELTVDRTAARRFLIRRSGLQQGRGEGREEKRLWAGRSGALEAVRALEYVQVDPMHVIERNHNLVLGARVVDYGPDILDGLLYEERRLVEVVARTRVIVPVEDYPLFRIRFADHERENRERAAELGPVMEKTLARIEQDGPLSSLDFEDKTTLSGWWDADGQNRTRAVRQALEWLWHFGKVAISHREGSRRYFDLPERLFGPEVLGPGDAASMRGPVPAGNAGAGGDEKRELRDALALKYFRAMGLSNPRDWSFGWSRYRAPEKKRLIKRFVGDGAILPVAIDGVDTTYFVPREEADDLAGAAAWEPEPEVRFLPPLDNLIWLRDRLEEVFEFDYTWEAYTPATKRNYGPYTCPILYGDRLVGRIDARVERGRRPRGEWILVVNGLWWEDGVGPGVADGEKGRGGRGGVPDRPAPDVFRAALEAWAALNGAGELDDSLAQGPRPSTGLLHP